MKEVIPGEIISHYRITEKLGEGGMGIVYKAEDTKLNRIVALKFLPAKLPGKKDAKQRFIQEAQAASSLQHINICTIHDIQETNKGQIFIVMDYYEGESLRDKIARGPLKPEEAAEISLQIANGLNAAHNKGIIHRDIKPANIFITIDGIVKILDFGLARALDQNRLINKQVTGGTINYMSPEQAKGGEVDHRTDIWAIGAILYEMITGKILFRGDYNQAILYLIMNQEPQGIRKLRSGVSKGLEQIVNKALAKYPGNRYQNVDELASDLRRELEKLDFVWTGYLRTKLINDKIKALKNRNTYVIIILAVIAIIIAAVFLIIRPFEAKEIQSSITKTSRNSLAVMYFDNIADVNDKNQTGEMLTNLLITSLSQFKDLEVISRERLLDIQKELGTGNSKVLLPYLAGQIAKYAGASTMVTGHILQEEPSITVTMLLIDVGTGRIISSQKVTNFPVNHIFGLVDSLTYLLSKDIPLISVSNLEIKDVANVTTNSLEAYRTYVEGLTLIKGSYFTEAKAAFERAVNLDSSFAMAYFYLSMYQQIEGEASLSWKSFQKAVELSNNVTECERLQILAVNYLKLNKRDKAIETLNQLIERYPHEIFPYSSLIVLYQKSFEPKKMIEICRLGFKNNPSFKWSWTGLAYAFSYLNQKSEAFNAINNNIDLEPFKPNPYDSKGDLYVWFMEYDSSSIEYKIAESLRRNFSSTNLGYYNVLRNNYANALQYFHMSGNKIPFIEIHRGQILKAQKITSDLLNSQISRNEFLWILRNKIHLAYETKQYSKMLLFSNRLSKELMKYPPERIYGRNYIAWSLAKLGRYSDAYKLLDSIHTDVAGTTPRLKVSTDYLSAIISFEKGNYEIALKQFEKAFDILPPNHEPNFFYSVCLLKCGYLQKATAEFKRLIYWPDNVSVYLLGNIIGAKAYWPVQAVKAHYWLGVAYEQQGQKDLAIKEYQTFLKIWKDADFDSPEIKDANIRVSRLGDLTFK